MVKLRNMNKPGSMDKTTLPMTVSLQAIFAEFPFVFSPAQIPATSITGIAIDNRKVEPGNLFVAMRGGSADGHDFIPDAIARGAAAVVCEKEITGLPVPCIRVQNSRQALTWLAAAFYDNPGRRLTVIGVTGTDGKTTTCNLLYQILLAAGLKAGLISTVNAIIGDEVLDTGFHVTTPDAPDVQHYLARMVEAGLTHAVLETTSHGWAQHRVDACEFDIGVITNITHEHLDQHGSYENYRAAKARLFQSLDKTRPKPQGNPRLAVLNKDDSSYEYLSSLASRPQISYGLGGSADIRAESIAYSPQGIQFEAVGDGFRFPVASPLVGAFNVSNCLAALAAAIRGLGVEPAAVAARHCRHGRHPGADGTDRPWPTLYRHRRFCPYPECFAGSHRDNQENDRQAGNCHLWVGGPARQGETPDDGRGGREWADASILTAEDPRSESLEGILEEMAAGARLRGRGGREILLACTGPGRGHPAGCSHGTAGGCCHGMWEGA